MKLKKKILGLLGLALGACSLHAQTVIENFEYTSQEELAAAWAPSLNAVVAMNGAVSSQTTGTNALEVTFNFPSTPYTTEFVTGPTLETPLSISATQYLSFRIKGDPAFAAANFRDLYLYAYDANGNFGRWGAAVPMSSAWQVMNFLASSVQLPWNTPGAPDLENIVKFAFFQYGSSEVAIPAYTAKITVDDITVRDTPLLDTAPVVERIIEAFEYATVEDLTAVWTPSLNAAISGTGLVSVNSPGTNAMLVTFNFPSVEYTTETARAIELAEPVAIAPEQYVSFRLKGDAAFAAADFKNLYVYAYDNSGNFGRWGGPVATTDAWAPVNYLASTIEKPWDSTQLPDLTQIVKFAFFQYGSQAAIPAYTASIAIDDLQVRNSPLVDIPPTAEKMLEDFEYPSIDEMLVAWTGSLNAIVAGTDAVTPRSSGTNALFVTFNFQSTPWATEIVRGPEFAAPISLGNNQYLTFRIKGDAAFAGTNFRDLYLYAYDADGKFGRWGAQTPISDEWVVWNFSAGSIGAPWDSPGLPNMGAITKLAFFQYGSSETPVDAYTATIGIDDIQVRNTPLTEFPLPATAGSLIENFESYPSETELLAFYSYISQPVATVTTATLETPAPQGTKALKLAIDFSAGQYPWGSLRSPKGAPFSFPTNAVVTMKFKGDAALAPVADGGTTFWLTLYDTAGGASSFIAPASVVINPEWQTLTAAFSDFSATATVDMGNIVQWRILVQGWEGTAETAAMSAAFYVDDIQMSVPVQVEAKLAVARAGSSTTVSWDAALTGYKLQSTASLTTPTWTDVTGVTGTEHTVPSTGTLFFRLMK